jgi:hypothetical protein
MKPSIASAMSSPAFAPAARRARHFMSDFINLLLVGSAHGIKSSTTSMLKLISRLAARRSRHLMSDFISLLPHSKKDVKLDTKSDRWAGSTSSCL